MADILKQMFANMAGGSWVKMPDPVGPGQWAHSVCTRSKLEATFADDTIKAIEADILIGAVSGAEEQAPKAEGVPIMAHPPSRVSDLSFEDFMEACIVDGRRHLKLDFKELAAVQKCLPLVSRAQTRLSKTGQAVWLNADILPGPGGRNKPPKVPADEFLQAVAEHCQGAPLSLGWVVHAAAGEGYSEADCDAMAELCKRQAAAGGGPVVFAACARLAARSPAQLVGLLKKVEGSQLLLWTGTKEPPVPQKLLDRLGAVFQEAGMEGRVGYDCQVAKTWMEGVGAELKMGLARWCLCVC